MERYEGKWLCDRHVVEWWLNSSLSSQMEGEFMNELVARQTNGQNTGGWLGFWIWEREQVSESVNRWLDTRLGG